MSYERHSIDLQDDKVLPGVRQIAPPGVKANCGHRVSPQTNPQHVDWPVKSNQKMNIVKDVKMYVRITVETENMQGVRKCLQHIRLFFR